MSSQTQDFLQKKINNFSLMLVVAFSSMESQSPNLRELVKKKKSSGSPSDSSMGQKKMFFTVHHTEKGKYDGWKQQSLLHRGEVL